MSNQPAPRLRPGDRIAHIAGRKPWLAVALAAGLTALTALAASSTEPAGYSPPPHGRTVELQAFSQNQEFSRTPIRLVQQTEAVPPFRTPQEPGAKKEPAPPAAPPSGRERPDFFTPDQVRLQALSGASQAGVTPRPTKEVQARYEQFIERTIDPDNTLDLIVGRPRLLVLKQIPSRVQIADEQIATYLLISRNEVSVVGSRVGSTVLNIWFGDQGDPRARILSYLVRVVPDPEEKERLDRVYDALTDEINRTFPDSVVKLTLVGDKVVVSGQAKDTVEAAQILRIVAANAPGGAGNRDGTPADEIPIGGVNLNVMGTPNELGNLPEQGLQNFLLRDIGRNVINLLRVPGEQQVMLRVTVAEVNRTAARSIGMDFSILNDAGSTVFSSITGGLIPTTVSGSGTTTQTVGGNLPVSIDNGQVRLAIEALRNINLARSLAEPNLTAMNGQSAQFRAGGQFPVPAGRVSFGAAVQGVEFVPFGVQLRFVPHITDRDRVRLQIGAEVSTRDASLGANIGGAAIAGGTSVTGLSARTFSTTVELREGQTLAVAGLIQNNFGATTNRVPLFGDLPLVGNAFGKNQTTAGEQELVILVTPELVSPLYACNTPPLPGSDVFEPGDCEFYLLNRLESRRSQDFRSAARTDYHRLKSYKQCEDVFIIGTRGRTINCCGVDPGVPCPQVAPPALPPPPVPRNAAPESVPPPAGAPTNKPEGPAPE